MVSKQLDFHFPLLYMMQYNLCFTTIEYHLTQSTNMLMPWWWIQGPSAHWLCYHPWLQAATHMNASNSSNQWSHTVALCTLAECTYSRVHRKLSNTMSTCTIWTVNMSSTMMQQCAQAKVAKHLFLRFHYGHHLFVVQMDLSRLKVVHCGQITLHWTLNHWQWPSRWATCAITRQ